MQVADIINRLIALLRAPDRNGVSLGDAPIDRITTKLAYLNMSMLSDWSPPRDTMYCVSITIQCKEGGPLVRIQFGERGFGRFGITSDSAGSDAVYLRDDSTSYALQRASNVLGLGTDETARFIVALAECSLAHCLDGARPVDFVQGGFFDVLRKEYS